ncbi:SsgA family sporulation/cell division regulator [Kitasatospora sp. MMS16-BH015]|uniref:SsgA family sporulation/cell division regulator n=1 Tax=Kitasatospora sp. MMS16-BH015 TaxID=2018025 RepID=UPI00131A5565|nr:SsgA family sporulation/cell division regulator [Kitasatospora sp. MMS16-BH015]
MTMRLLVVETWHELEVECQYWPEDPYAVLLDFGTGRTEWILSREVLTAGLVGPAGEGDVHVEPADGGRVHVALGRGERVALLSLPADGLDRFLAETRELVPPGAEPGRIDWDLCIRELLSA